jgi:hypothetical protein
MKPQTKGDIGVTKIMDVPLYNARRAIANKIQIKISS